jgi:hypothetical protein
MTANKTEEQRDMAKRGFIVDFGRGPVISGKEDTTPIVKYKKENLMHKGGGRSRKNQTGTPGTWRGWQCGVASM